MPTYDYVCDACGHKFEHFQSITEEHLKKCPECKMKKLRRLIGAGAAIMFKGSGFYITDYRSDSYKERAKADSAAASAPPAESSSTGSSSSGGESSGGSSTSSGESKPAANSSSGSAAKPSAGKAKGKGK